MLGATRKRFVTQYLSFPTKHSLIRKHAQLELDAHQSQREFYNAMLDKRTTQLASTRLDLSTLQNTTFSTSFAKKQARGLLENLFVDALVLEDAMPPIETEIKRHREKTQMLQDLIDGLDDA